MKQELVKYLSEFITPARLMLFNKVKEERTRYITVVLEDIYQSHNASAVLRSCDCFGIQDIHIIENKHRFTVNPDIALGASLWLNLIHYKEFEDNTKESISVLKERGYRIVATLPDHNKSVGIEEFDLQKGKIALFFGTEISGLKEEVKDMADEFLTIPMFGFTRSFNISVSAAIILFSLTNRLRQSEIDWRLNEEEKTDLMLQWLRSSIKNSDCIEKELIKKIIQNNGR